MVKELLFYFFIGLFSCIGFCLLINIPRRSILIASTIGGIGWVVYQYYLFNGSTKPMSAFIGAFIVALLSDFSSRKFKEATTVYIIPGILPLVPGAGMYYTMLELINTNYDKAVANANSTFFVAGAIAMALLVVGSLTKTFTSMFSKVFKN